MNFPTKAEAILDAIRQCEVGDDVIVHNEKGMVWCIVRIIAKEHLEERPEG